MWPLTLAVVLLLYTFGPGMLLVRPLRLPGGERLVVAIGVGLFVDFLFSFAIFALRLAQSTHLITSIVALVLGMVALRDWQRVLRSRQARRLLICWGCILAWGLILLSMIRHFGGGTWSGDWVEQLERTNFFMTSSMPEFTFQQTFLQEMKYPVPMRPPMINAITAGALSQAVESEQIFTGMQLAYLLFNSLVFLPCALLIPRLVKLPPRLARKATWTLAAVFAASPMFCQNLTYTWTKLFGGFYAVLAIVVYMRAWRRSSTPSPGTTGEGRGGGLERGAAKEDSTSTARNPLPNPPPEYRRRGNSTVAFALAFALLCIGMLVHYSVGPYGLFLGLHYLIAVWWRRPAKWREAAIIAGSSGLVLAFWFSWSIATYGQKTTFGSPSTVSDAVKMTPAENVASIARNFRNTLIPRIVQRPDLIRAIPEGPPTNVELAGADEDTLSIHDLEQPSLAGRVRDFFFLIYQVSLPGGLGLFGWAIACWLLWKAWRPGNTNNLSVRVFWMTFIPAIFILAVGTYGGRDRFGVAHVSMQPLILIGLSFLAGGFWTLNIPLRALFAAGLLLDFSLGVFLQETLQHYVFQLVPVYDDTGHQLVTGGQPTVKLVESPDMPGHSAQFNMGQKTQGKLIFWGDYFTESLPFQILLGLGLAGLMAIGLLPPRTRQSGEPIPPLANLAPRSLSQRSGKSKKRR
jgi:hypothetical protein